MSVQILTSFLHLTWFEWNMFQIFLLLISRINKTKCVIFNIVDWFHLFRLCLIQVIRFCGVVNFIWSLNAIFIYVSGNGELRNWHIETSRRFQDVTGNTRCNRKMYLQQAFTCLRIYKGKHTTRPRAKSVTSITTVRSLSAVSLVVTFLMILESYSRTLLTCSILRSVTLA